MAAPPVDRRTQPQLSAAIHAALAADDPSWPAGGPGQGAAAALVEVMARYAALVIEHINAVPDRDRLAFLSYLGGALLPPQPARVPLTFALAPGGVTAAVVGAGTQVAAAPAPGVSAPVLFETDTELVVTAAKLDQLFVRSPESDRYADLTSVLTSRAEQPLQVFTTDRPIEHILYIGVTSFFGAQALNQLILSFALEEGLNVAQQAASWEVLTPAGGDTLAAESDATEGITQSGDVVFKQVPAFAPAVVAGVEAFWLQCRLLKPLARPIVARSLTMERVLEKGGLPLDVALHEGPAGGTAKLDLGKDFLPLGSKPRFGDALYLAAASVLSLEGAQVTLRITVTNTAEEKVEVPVPRVYTGGRARVSWEYWDGALWSELGTMSTDEDVSNAATAFTDTTRALTKSGEVSFRVPKGMQPVELSGLRALWLRARLSANHYGEEAGYTDRETKPGVHEFAFRPATLSPPLLKKIEVGFVLHELARQPEHIVTYNDFTYAEITSPIKEAQGAAELFSPARDPETALYLGFLPPGGLPMPTLPLSIYFVFEPGAHTVEDEEGSSRRIAWQFWNGQTWEAFSVTDRTGAFAYSGSVSMLVPAGAVRRQEFGLERYWLRVPWRGGRVDRTALLRLALLNTVGASQNVTLTNEVLGSSSGAPRQTMHTALHPVLEDEWLEVRAAVRKGGGRGQEVWTRWEGVADFHGSSSLDQHYLLDRITGAVTFGDGSFGAIPPAGSSNVRMARYRTGGGIAGNKGEDTIIQLKTTVPYVRGVTNVEPATGGADAETIEELQSRAPKNFRHRSRAVTLEDYEDLAMLASPGVARARCVPLANLLLDPDARQVRPGVVSLILVPRSDGDMPLPGQALLAEVRSYLLERQSATVELVLTGAEYVAYDVEAELGVTTLEGVMELEAAVRGRLSTFLRTLGGGFDRSGWDFGRRPHRSDLFSLLSGIRGVDHVRLLDVVPREARPGAARTDRFLICPGALNLSFTLV